MVQQYLWRIVRLVEHIFFENRGEIPLASGALEPDLGFSNHF
jgi:hypothetical protein